MRRRNALAALFLLLILPGFQTPSWALPDELKPVEKVALQPLVAQVRSVKEALNYIGRPLSAAESSSLDAAFEKGGEAAVAGIQGVLAPHVLFAVHINPESRVKVARGPAAAECIQQGWRAFLVRVHNEAGVTAALKVPLIPARSTRPSPDSGSSTGF